MATRYLVTGGASVIWSESNTDIWSATSGGAGGASVPVDGDLIIFNGSSGGGTVTLGYSPTVASITMGSYSNGTFDASTFDITMSVFSCTGVATRTLKLGTGKWTLKSFGTVWNTSTITGLTFDAGTSTIVIDHSSTTNSKTFSHGGLTYNNLLLTGTGSGDFIIGVDESPVTFNNFRVGVAPAVVRFADGATITVNSFWVRGSPGAEITIDSVTTATHTLNKSTEGPMFGDYLNIQHSVASSNNTWYAGNNSTNNQGVSSPGARWIFSEPSESVLNANKATVQDKLNRMAGTTGRRRSECMNILAGTSGLPYQDAWNVFVGTTGRRKQFCANKLVGTQDLRVGDCLDLIFL